MKVTVISILVVILSFGLTTILSAGEDEIIINPNSLSMNHLFANINFLADGDSSDLKSSDGNFSTGGFSTGRRVSAGFMNILFGLGSYTMGDWKGGLVCTLFDVVTIPLFAISIGIFANNDGWFPFPKYSGMSTGNIGLDMALLMPVWYSFGVVLWTLPYIGIIAYPLTYLYKFLRPFQYQKPELKTARLDDLRNWNVGVAMDNRGRLNGQISFTAHL